MCVFRIVHPALLALYIRDKKSHPLLAAQLSQGEPC